MNLDTEKLKFVRKIKKINGELLDARVSEQRVDYKKSRDKKIKLDSEGNALLYLFECFEGPWIDAHTAVLSEKPDIILFLNNEQKISLELFSISVEYRYIFEENSKKKYFK